jgi:ketosteroid isomerase-like protein
MTTIERSEMNVLERDLRDRAAIEDLLHHYCWLVDSRDPDRLLDEFYADDAVDDHGAVQLSGPEAIGHFMRTLMEWSQGHAHVLSNVVVELHGDEATARSYVTAWHWFASSAGEGHHRPADYTCVGQYHDRLRRTERGWRVFDRRFATTAPGYVAAGAFPVVEFT